MKKLRHFLPPLFTLLFLFGIIFPVQARGIPPAVILHQAFSAQPPQTINTSSDCFAFSNEATGDLISQLDTAGAGDFNLFDTLLWIQTSTNPAVSGIITDPFLAALSSNPASSAIFTTLLKTVDTPGNIMEVCDNGTVQTVPVYGFYSTAQGFPTLITTISGVGYANFTHTTDTSGYIATWDGTSGSVTTTYRVFGVAWVETTVQALPAAGGQIISTSAIRHRINRCV